MAVNNYFFGNHFDIEDLELEEEDQYMEALPTEDDNSLVQELNDAMEGNVIVWRELSDNKILRKDPAYFYYPFLVAIGPKNRYGWLDNGSHLENRNIGIVEALKVHYLKAFLNRTKMELETIVSAVMEWENRVSEFYATRLNDEVRQDYMDNYKSSPLRLWKMIILDSCFIIEVIWRYTFNRVPDQADYLNMPRIILDARRDMILLDNQLPFFVLESLFNLAFPSNNRSFIQLALVYLSDFMLIAESSQAIESIDRQKPINIKHFVDLIRICHAPTLPRQPPADRTKLIAMLKATQLEGFGMVIKPSSSTIRYSRGKLEIPKMKINDKSETLLKNLIKFELREHQYDSYIIDYLHFMDGVIDTAKDVDILVHNEVIENYLRDSKAVATLFNGITAEATLFTPNYYYYGICEKLNAYCKVKVNRWWAALKRDYCSSPWIIASTIAAVILLVLTSIQTIVSIISIT